MPSLNDALDINNKYLVQSGIYLLGSLERGVTVYKQQVRAHNLIWALWELKKAQRLSVQHVAVVGGGIAGLTATACLMSRFPELSIVLFEKLVDLCPLQQGCDNRWIHPRIYDWPALGSRAPSAGLPVLNWSEGRAADVARTVIRTFAAYCDKFDPDKKRLSVVLDTNKLLIDAMHRSIEWAGRRTDRKNSYFKLQEPTDNKDKFDIIILAPGYGLETNVRNFHTLSYWRNEQNGQPRLDNGQTRFVVSGFGDGALVDLFRLTIERFRQDTIVYELFEPELERIEESLRRVLPANVSRNLFPIFENIRDATLSAPLIEMGRRLRKDTSVELHIRGKDGNIKSIEDVFEKDTSFLNRLLLYILYRSNGFIVSMAPLENAVTDHGAANTDVICRYGTDPVANILSMFSNPSSLEPRLSSMQRMRAQDPTRLWKLGSFPTLV